MLQALGVGYRAAGRSIFADVDLTVEDGHSVAVTGPSGSGKTSLLAILAGLTAPTEGTVLIDGKALTGFAGQGRGVSVVLQATGSSRC